MTSACLEDMDLDQLNDHHKSLESHGPSFRDYIIGLFQDANLSGLLCSVSQRS